MSDVSAMARRLRTVSRHLRPRPKQERWMPTGVHLYRDETGIYYFLPGMKEMYERSQLAGIVPCVYVNLLPGEDGCCNCDNPPREGRCPCSQRLWDEIDLSSLEKAEVEV